MVGGPLLRRADAQGALPAGRPGRAAGSPTPARPAQAGPRGSGPVPSGASWIFPLAPLVLVGTTVVVAAIAPLLATDPAFGWSADLFAVVYLLLLGSVALALGALDTGTAFGGMGASRAMTIGALAEPALLVAILALSVPAHSSNLPTIITRSLAHPLWLATPQRLLALVAFVIVIVAESGRLPVDNPSTHLELTMIHEAMVLEYAGPDLALVKLGESMRLVVLVGPVRRPLRPLGHRHRTGSRPSGARTGRDGGQGRRARRRAWPSSRWRWPSSASSGCPS